MATRTFQRKALEDAKEKGLHLLKIEIIGRHAKQDSMAMSCSMGPKMAARVKELWVDLCDNKKRMQ